MFNCVRRFLSNIITPPQFIITIKNGKSQASLRKVTKTFLNECDKICEDNKISQGEIYGMNCEYGIRLEFSANIPKTYHQNFRNIWNIVK